MNKKWLTVIVKPPFVWLACSIVVLIAALIGYVFWPVESQPDTEPQAMQIQAPEKNSASPPAAIEEPGPAQQPTASSEDREYARVVAYYQKIIEQNPGTPQAKRAKNLLREVTAEGPKQPAQSASVRPGKPQLKRSRPLRRRTIRRDTMEADFYEIDDQH